MLRKFSIKTRRQATAPAAENTAVYTILVHDLSESSETLPQLFATSGACLSIRTANITAENICLRSDQYVSGSTYWFVGCLQITNSASQPYNWLTVNTFHDGSQQTSSSPTYFNQTFCKEHFFGATPATNIESTLSRVTEIPQRIEEQKEKSDHRQSGYGSETCQDTVTGYRDLSFLPRNQRATPGVHCDYVRLCSLSAAGSTCAAGGKLRIKVRHTSGQA